MTSQFSPKVSEILAFSREEAARLASRSVGPEHLLLGMLRSKDGPVIDLFHKLNLNMQNVKTELEKRVREDEIDLPIHTTDLVLNEKASNILKLAVLEARIQRTIRVDEQHLLLAILHDVVNNGAKQVLELNNITIMMHCLYSLHQKIKELPTASDFLMKTRRNSRRLVNRLLHPIPVRLLLLLKRKRIQRPLYSITSVQI